MVASKLENLDQVVELLVRSSRVIALTGAGISVESGIPAFRGSQGLWNRYDPIEYAHIDSFRTNPARVWEMLKEMRGIVEKAQPNAAHQALVQLERLGRLDSIITQNVDNLHQAAGSTDVIEFHGNGATLVCLDCHRRTPRHEVSLEKLPPLCPCGGVLKPGVVFFGEPIPPIALTRAYQAASVCELMLVIGTSAEVAPASLMPEMASQSGAKIVEVNTEPTDLTGRLAGHTLLGSAGQIMPLVAAQLRAALSD